MEIFIICKISPNPSFPKRGIIHTPPLEKGGIIHTPPLEKGGIIHTPPLEKGGWGDFKKKIGIQRGEQKIGIC